MAENKKGEGSRGGHIIRHTKSGAAVYGSPRDTVAKSPSKIKAFGKAAAKVVGGAALTVAGGYAAGGMVRAAAKLANKAHDVEKAAGVASKFAVRARFGQHLLERAEEVTKFATSGVGAVLIGKGAAEGAQAAGVKQSVDVGIAAGATAAILSRTGFYRNLLPKGSRGAFRMALKKGGKAIESPKFRQGHFRFKKPK